MTFEQAAAVPVVVDEPSALRSLWASIQAVFAKESRWRMRGRRAFVVVTIYVALTALLMFAVYQLLYDRAVQMAQFEGNFGQADVVSGAVSASIGQAIFTSILVIQTFLSLMVAPALTSGSISSERERQTLELLISTPMSTLGMVVGKLISSLAFLFLLIGASVPLMAVVFIFGGIAPEDVVRAYVMLIAAAVGLGSIGLFMSALLKRTQAATALSYVIVLMLAFGSLALHTYLLAVSQRDQFIDGREVRPPPEAIMWLNPFVADIDLACTAIPESFGFTCSYISLITGRVQDGASPPRDAFWPRSAAAFLGLGIVLTLATTQLIAPSRRLRRPTSQPGVEEVPALDGPPPDEGPPPDQGSPSDR